MPQLRKDPVVGRWVIIASDRKFRPSSFIVEESLEPEGQFCPFCSGNEEKTPPEIYAVRPDMSPPNSPGWTVRVVPNKYPALKIEGTLDKKGEGMYDLMNGIGAHEVVIESPEHSLQMEDFSLDHLGTIIRVYRDRCIDLKRDQRLRYLMLFKNFGKEAGASLVHSHTQIIATPVTPKRVKEELAGAKRYYEYKDRCVFCDMLDQEIEKKERVVAVNQGFIAMAPFASRFPFETWIVPIRHSPDFEALSESEEKQFAEIIHIVLKKLSLALTKPPYNFVLHSSPNRYFRPGHWETIEKDYHWHLEVIPRLTNAGGFEWGTGFYINPTSPEEAAEFLQSVTIE